MMKPFLVLALAGSALVVAVPAMAQDAMAAAPSVPMCSAKVKDGCMQTPAQQKRAMSGEQADARDARHGGMWAPNAVGSDKPDMMAKMDGMHKMHKKHKKMMMMKKTEMMKTEEPKPM